MDKKIQAYLYSINGQTSTRQLLRTVLRDPAFRYLFYFRMQQKGRCSVLFRLLIRHVTAHTGIKIGRRATIGKGLRIVHHGDIDINSETIIGNNCNITAGVTIGITNRGPRRGCPTIGNEVWIGTKSVIVGIIKIGNNVLIAPLSYVNIDVPDNSIVIGNPAKIISRANATENHIEFPFPHKPTPPLKGSSINPRFAVN